MDDDENLESDVVFGVTSHLIGDFHKGEGAAPAPDVTGDWHSLDYAFVMEEGESKLPIPRSSNAAPAPSSNRQEPSCPSMLP